MDDKILLLEKILTNQFLFTLFSTIQKFIYLFNFISYIVIINNLLCKLLHN